MGLKKNMKLFILIAVVGMLVLSETGEAASKKCMNRCMPACLGSPQATYDPCVDACRNFCNEKVRWNSYDP